jgi:hypothetical protein
MELPVHEDKDAAKSILKELIVNQYQAIVLGGVGLASALTLNPMPILLWLGAELVMLPILDSGPLRRLVARRRLERARKESFSRRKRVIAAFTPEFSRRYNAMETLCRQIESNYQGLHGISQSYLSEQRGKLDQILAGCVERMTALQRYERTLERRPAALIEGEIEALEEDLKDPELNERARSALAKNLELKQRLLASHLDALGTMKALATELDSMASLLEVLHQSSISMRDPDAISDELDSIVRQSESSNRVVREMESMLRDDVAAWDVSEPDAESATLEPQARDTGRKRRKESGR